MFRGNAVVATTGDRIRDTVILTIRGDGLDLPLQYITSKLVTAPRSSGRKTASGAKPTKGMNIPEMMKYIDRFMEFIEEPSCLCLDMASSHTSKVVRSYVESFKLSDGRQAVEIKLLKPKTAFLESPLDMGAIAEFKGYYYKLDRSTLPLKKAAAVQAWRKVSNDNLRSYIKNCGFFSNESLDDIRVRFMKEVRHGIPENFKDLWDFYDGWKSGSYEVEGIAAVRGVPLEKPEQLDDDFLDGKYWTLYGSGKKK